jgi:hypothetical protein
VALTGQYNLPGQTPLYRDVCLVAKVHLGAQSVSGGLEFTDQESKIDAGSSPESKSQHQNVRKNAAHKECLQEKSHVHKAKFNGRPKLPGCQGKDGAAAFGKKARARGGQREVGGDKGQWGFVLQGIQPSAAQAAEWWQGAGLIM